MKIEPRTFTLPNGEVLTVRSLCADDAEALSAFRNAIYSETHFMARYPEEGASLEAMRNWLAGFVESPVNFEVGAMQLAIGQTRANGFEQLELGVYSDNARAIHLYEKFGFERYGIQPRAFKLKDGTYRDEIIMVKML